MQQDFHYYATYCAAVIAGYSHEDSMKLCFSAEMVDHCSRTFLKKLHADGNAATTQLQLEMINADTSLIGLQDITRIWASFHFLPYDLYADPHRGSWLYKCKYRLLCDTNGDLLVQTLKLAAGAGTLPAAGIAMHVLADTWAHRYFAGTPSFVINNTDYFFYELLPGGNSDSFVKRGIRFSHNPSAKDDLEKGRYTNTVQQISESSIMNLGHGRAGHLPDYSFIRYQYLPAWDDYAERTKDNPSDYYHAFCQMIYAMKYLRGEISEFQKDCYDFEAAEPYKQEIMTILTKRQYDGCADWKALGERLSGHVMDAFDTQPFEAEYLNAQEDQKAETLFGEFIDAALLQKRMVTGQIFKSGNLLAGLAIMPDTRPADFLAAPLKLFHNDRR